MGNFYSVGENEALVIWYRGKQHQCSAVIGVIFILNTINKGALIREVRADQYFIY